MYKRNLFKEWINDYSLVDPAVVPNYPGECVPDINVQDIDNRINELKDGTINVGTCTGGWTEKDIVNKGAEITGSFIMNSDHTLEEVGQQFSVTRERIRQIEAKALRKLKHPSRSRKLRSFLDQ